MSLAAGFERTFAIAAKELRQLSCDRLTLTMVVGIPLILVLIFGYGINFDIRHIRAGVVDLANTSASRALVADLAASQVVDFVARTNDPRELRRLIDIGAIKAGIYLPPDFERRRIEGRQPMAQLFIDGSEPGVEGAVAALAQMPPLPRAGLNTESVRAFEILREYNLERRTAVQIVPALIGVILNMTMVVFTAIALVRERERGNLELLITTPVKSVELMIGTLAPYVLLGLIQTTVILILGVMLFDMPVHGSLVRLYLAAGLFIVATLALGLVISTIAKTQFQAMQLGFFTMLPSILLSGFMFPFDGMPTVVQWIAQVIPLTHFVDLVRGIVLRGAELTTLLEPLAKLVVFILVAVTFAAVRFRKRLD
jgi:ABC-2 type transport system permease protein